MGIRSFLGWDAGAEEKGSFCDTTSNREYLNLSDQEADAAVESAMRRGDTVSDDREGENRYNRSNWELVDSDSQGQDYQPRYGPGN